MGLTILIRSHAYSSNPPPTRFLGVDVVWPQQPRPLVWLALGTVFRIMDLVMYDRLSVRHQCADEGDPARQDPDSFSSERASW